MPCDSIVRIAIPEDRNEIWRLALMDHRESGVFNFAPDKVEFFIERTLNPDLIHPADTGPRGTMAVIGTVGKLEALALVTIAQPWYSHDRFISEHTVYVDPECRNSAHAKALMGWLTQQVADTGLPLVAGVVSRERSEAKCKLFGRNFPKVGEFFLLMPSDPVVFGSSSHYVH